LEAAAAGAGVAAAGVVAAGAGVVVDDELSELAAGVVVLLSVDALLALEPPDADASAALRESVR
jgi:hypothetical protein